MSYRNGIYVAFNGCQTTDASKSDIHYFNIMKAWKQNHNIEFDFADSHAKTYQVKDSSEEKTLLSRLSQRLRESKVLLVIVTENTNSSLSRLEWEINQAVKVYNLPIIVAYTMHKGHLDNPSPYKKYIPQKLTDYMRDNETSVLHIPFELGPIQWAIKNHTVHANLIAGSRVLTESTYTTVSDNK